MPASSPPHALVYNFDIVGGEADTVVTVGYSSVGPPGIKLLTIGAAPSPPAPAPAPGPSPAPKPSPAAARVD
jgi:hypothetical protein